MIAYVDASVLLRLALGQPDALHEWRDVHRGVLSALITVESLRTLDRLRVRAKLTDSEIAGRRATVMATHDRALAIAAQAHGLMAIGIEE
ncbi:MAG TPA: hypothetical protein VH640_10495 [Bryobacteraceae bacterium]